MSDTFVIILVGLIGIGIGFAIGMLVNSLRNPQNESEQRKQPVSGVKAQPGTSKRPVLETPIQTTTSQTERLPQTQDQPAANRPNLNPLDIFAHALQPNVQSVHPYSRSIAEQIDEILQEMLEKSTLRSKAIRLLELPQKGMVVMVGLDQYQGVEAVPDEEIRNLIRSAVTEWERRVSEESTEKV